MREFELDISVRLAAFAFLTKLRQVHNDLLPRRLLEAGFDWQGQRVPLLGPQGIFKPAVLPDVPLSITTVPIVPGKARPYDDEDRGEGVILYRYRGVDPNHRDNVGLRLAMELRTPLIYFSGLAPGLYSAAWPVYIMAEERTDRAFLVQADQQTEVTLETIGPEAEGRRRYITRLVQQRLHQQAFRVQVIRAYRVNCAVCTLHDHPELLDAAHILPDTDPRAVPVVPNGLSLCKLHHAAFDANLIGIRPDYVVEVRRDVLLEIDGPMLRHGLQGMDKRQLVVPRRQPDRPNQEFLEERYELFRKAG